MMCRGGVVKVIKRMGGMRWSIYLPLTYYKGYVLFFAAKQLQDEQILVILGGNVLSPDLCLVLKRTEFGKRSVCNHIL